MSNKQEEQFFRMELKGVAKDAHQRFPINFAYGQSGVAYFNGCKVEATIERGGKTITNRMDVQAFGPVAEELACVVDGTEVHVKGEFGKRKSTNSNDWYDVVTIDEIISIG
jgi:hypothetical protein